MWFTTWDEDHPWGHLTGAGSSAQPSVTPARQQEKSWQPITVESGEVQRLTDLPEALGLPIVPAKDAPLSIVEMALRFPDQGVVVPGSSFWISDSGLQCIRTRSKWNEPLKKSKLESTEPYIRNAMMLSDPHGLFCFYVEKGGKVNTVLRDLHKAIKELEAEATRMGIIAEAKFPMFEHGSIRLFHNYYGEWGIVRCQDRYGSAPVPGRLAPVNGNYWNQLDEIADIMSVLVKKPNALIGGDPTK